MRVKTFFTNCFLFITINVSMALAIVLNVLFTNILEDKTSMKEIASSLNEINRSATPIYVVPQIKKSDKVVYEEGKSFGIDVSKYQGDIDWFKVKNSGVDFAIIRVGYRGYKGGDINIDENFYKNIEGAIKNNIDVGIYFYSAARNEREAIKEAKWVVDTISPYKNKIAYPVVFDLEDFNRGRLEYTSNASLNKAATAFLDYIDKSGYNPMLYGSRSRFGTTWYNKTLSKYKVWLAHYIESTDYKGKYDMWQYTSTGKVDGIKGNVDINIAYFKLPTNSNTLDINEKIVRNTHFDTVNENVVVNTLANFRKSPTLNLDNEITDPLPKGTALKKVGISSGGWAKVIYNGTTGYILDNYLTRI